MSTKRTLSLGPDIEGQPFKKASIQKSYYVIFQKVNYARRSAASQLISTHGSLSEARDAGIKYLEQNGGKLWVEDYGERVRLSAHSNDGFHLVVEIQVEPVALARQPLAVPKVFVIMRRDMPRLPDPGAGAEVDIDEALGNCAPRGVFVGREAANKKAREILREICHAHGLLGPNGNILCDHGECMSEEGLYNGNACLDTPQTENVDIIVEAHDVVF